MDASIEQLLGGAAVLVGVVAGAVALPKFWRPVRRLISLVDTLAGRPERYPGDREARPGLVERLDRIESGQEQVKAELSELRKEIGQTNSRLRRVESAMNGWLPPPEDGHEPETVGGTHERYEGDSES